MANDWEIKRRAECCAETGREFEEGEWYYTLLFLEADGFSRKDLCEQAWKDRNDNIQPFSFWRAKFESPPPPEEVTLKKETAEDLLRHYMAKNNAEHGNARYILALMLERKRVLKQIEVKETHEGRTLIYEHSKTGEVFLVPEPRLRLDQIESVQNEVAAILK
jgi:hypothetical protein